MGVADKIEQEIKQWIQQAVEPKDKALLMILFQMNANLIENTTITKAVATDFHTHRDTVNTILNRVRGGWFVLGFALIVVQGLGLWIINGQMNALQMEQGRNAQQEVVLARLQAENIDLQRRIHTLELISNGLPR